MAIKRKKISKRKISTKLKRKRNPKDKPLTKADYLEGIAISCEQIVRFTKSTNFELKDLKDFDKAIAEIVFEIASVRDRVEEKERKERERFSHVRKPTEDPEHPDYYSFRRNR